LYWTVTAGANGQLNAAYLESNPEFLDDPANFIGLPRPIVDDVRQAIAARIQAAPRRAGGQSQDEINATVKRKIAQLRGLGVQMVFGTDVGSWGEVTAHATWMEADLWVRELGLDPMSVIRAMTLDAARMMAADQASGSIAEGKLADVIAVRGDPLRHIGVLREPQMVISRGRRFK
jgi:imidazolonepropionase-like amidohydrolase